MLFFRSFEEEEEVFIVPLQLRRALTSFCYSAGAPETRLFQTVQPKMRRDEKKDYNLMCRPAEAATNKPLVALSETMYIITGSYSSRFTFSLLNCTFLFIFSSTKIVVLNSPVDGFTVKPVVRSCDRVTGFSAELCS